MEKIRIQICGRAYNLLSDDGADRILELANKLEAQINEYKTELPNKTEAEILTLLSLNIMDEFDKEKSKLLNDISGLKEEIDCYKQKVSEFEEKMQSTLAESVTSASMELQQIASVMDNEKDELRKKLMEYEDNFGILVEEKEAEISELREGFDSARSEMEHIAMVKDTDNAKLRNTLNSYEKTFDLYVKTKEEEIISLKNDLEVKQTECDVLRQRLAALNDEGQLTLC